QRPQAATRITRITLRADRREQAFQLGEAFDFRRHATRVLQDPEGNTLLFRDEHVIVQVERLAGPGQVVEFAARDRLGGAVFDDLRKSGKCRLGHVVMLAQPMAAPCPVESAACRRAQTMTSEKPWPSSRPGSLWSRRARPTAPRPV